MEVKDSEWGGVKEKYKKIVLKCYNNNLNARIPNPDINHAKFLTYLLLKKAKKSIRIFTGCLKKDLYDDPKIKEALSSLTDVKIEIITQCEKECNLNYPHLEISIKKADSSNAVKNIPGHFIVIDSTSYRYEKYHEATDVSNIKGTANFNDSEIASSMENVFDNVLKVHSH